MNKNNQQKSLNYIFLYLKFLNIPYILPSLYWIDQLLFNRPFSCQVILVIIMMDLFFLCKVGRSKENVYESWSCSNVNIIEYDPRRLFDWDRWHKYSNKWVNDLR